MHPGDAPRILRAEKFEMKRGGGERTVAVLSRGSRASQPHEWRDFGIALCDLYRATPSSAPYERGLRLLSKAVALSPRDARAIAALAAAWKPLDPAKARALYRTAFDLDPFHPQVLASVVDCAAGRRDAATRLAALEPVIRGALKRHGSETDAGTRLPQFHFEWSKLHALAGHPYEALAACARGVHASHGIVPSASALESVRRLQRALGSEAPHLEWLRRFLMLALVVRWSPESKSRQRGERERATTADRQAARRTACAAEAAIHSIANAAAGPLEGPVLIVPGGTCPAVERKIRSYQRLLEEALRDFRGTVISGGTTAGIGGMVGELAVRPGAGFHTLGYIPKGRLPREVAWDERYHEIRRTEPGSFSALEPLQNWIDIVGSGVWPADVKVLGIGGDTIAAAEYHIAIALGAQVGLVEGSGGEAARTLADPRWSRAAGVVPLPADPFTVRSFFTPAAPRLAPPLRERLARAIHAVYRANREQRGRERLPTFDELTREMRESNASQADQIGAKLKRIGCQAVAVEGRAPALLEFSAAEIQTLAEMEHGRWNVERLLGGWRRGPVKSEVEKKSPYLVPWRNLPEAIRENDRQFVREIPRILAGAGIEVRRGS